MIISVSNYSNSLKTHCIAIYNIRDGKSYFWNYKENYWKGDVHFLSMREGLSLGVLGNKREVFASFSKYYYYYKISYNALKVKQK